MSHRVGIIGLQPGRSWAARAHLPALAALGNDFEVAGVANSSKESAEAAAKATGVARAFASTADLVASKDVDIVVVTVKVPHHLALVKAALENGKHLFCEWPLGNGLAEAEELAALAKAKGVVAVVGTQARVAPEVMYLRDLVKEGHVGEVLSSTVTAFANGWGAEIPSESLMGYLLDRANGASMLSIPVGHTLAGIQEALGSITELSAVLANRRTEVKVLDTGKTLPMTSHDQVLVAGVLANGAPLSLHYRGGAPRGGPGLVWEVNGTAGDLRITGPFGHTQLVPLVIESLRGDAKEYARLEVPASFHEGLDLDASAGNVARLYKRMAADLRDGTRTAPTFDDAVALHRVLDTIERSRPTRVPT